MSWFNHLFPEEDPGYAVNDQPGTSWLPDLNQEYVGYDTRPEQFYGNTGSSDLPNLNQVSLYSLFYFVSDYGRQLSYPSSVAWSDYGGQATSLYQPPVANDPFYGTESSSHHGRNDYAGPNPNNEDGYETHNHDPVEFEEGCASFRKMNTDQLDMVESLHRAGVKPQEIEAALREKFPGVQPVLKDIYNHTAKIMSDGLLGDTPMKALENFLADNGFTLYTRESDIDDRTEEIFFCHSKSHKMWRAFPEVLMVDTTYNTNMYDWPLVQFIGVTSTSQSFVSPPRL
ncbi:protein FAR1-RELATED SEQUENCE 5-like [Bidens hawaiensis]|uniref:protein FAR1-RELATED SEQUENCE 5-like n=1 Tax=Bidens hawaiensis TaxID=980011 RepID=UPI004049A4BF